MNNHGRVLDLKTGRLSLLPGMEEALDWLCGDRPMIDSRPEHTFEFEARIGRGRGFVSRCKKDSSFRAHWEDRMRQYNSAPDRLQDLLDAQYEKAMKGDTKAFEAYMRHIGKLMPTAAGVDAVTEQMSDEELQAALDKVRPIAQAR